MALYDQVKGAFISNVDDDITPNDIQSFCEDHDVSFYALGTPPGIGGSGWDDPTVFRVSTRPGMLDGSPRGLTVPISQVRKWKLARQAATS